MSSENSSCGEGATASDGPSSQSGLLQSSVADPDPGSGAFLTLGSGMGKKSGSGMNNPDHISESLETIFLGLKYVNSFMCIRDGKNDDPGSGMQKNLIRNTASISVVYRHYFDAKISGSASDFLHFDADPNLDPNPTPEISHFTFHSCWIIRF
jgi:hypothetical protein